MKANSLSFKVVKSVFQKNEKCPSYDALNDHRYSKNDKSKIFKSPFLGSHNSNSDEIALGYI